MEEKKIGFIGAGKMATAIAGGIVNSGFFDKKNVFAYDINENARGETLSIDDFIALSNKILKIL